MSALPKLDETFENVAEPKQGFMARIVNDMISENFKILRSANDNQKPAANDNLPSTSHDVIELKPATEMDVGVEAVGMVGHDSAVERLKLSENAKLGEIPDTDLAHLDTKTNTHALAQDVHLSQTESLVQAGSEIWTDEVRLKDSLDDTEATMETIERAGVVYDSLPGLFGKMEAGEVPFLYRKDNDDFAVVGWLSEKDEDGNVIAGREGILAKLKNNFSGGIATWLDGIKKSARDIGIWWTLRQNIRQINRTYKSGKQLVDKTRAELAEYEKIRDELGDYKDSAVEAAKLKREFERVDDATATTIIRQGFGDLLKKGPRLIAEATTGALKGPSAGAAFAKQSGLDQLQALQQTHPKAFAEVTKEYGIKAHKIRKEAFHTSIVMSLFDWYIHPSDRTSASLGEELLNTAKGAIPFTWLGDLDEIAKLPAGMRYTILAANLGLDLTTFGAAAATVLTGGAAAPSLGAISAGRSALGAGLRGGTKLATSSTRATVAGAGRIFTKMSPSQFLQGLPKASADSLRSIAKSGTVRGVGSYVAISHGLDFLLAQVDERQIAIDIMNREMDKKTPQQLRAIRMFMGAELELLSAQKRTAQSV